MKRERELLKQKNTPTKVMPIEVVQNVVEKPPIPPPKKLAVPLQMEVVVVKEQPAPPKPAPKSSRRPGKSMLDGFVHKEVAVEKSQPSVENRFSSNTSR